MPHLTKAKAVLLGVTMALAIYVVMMLAQHGTISNVSALEARGVGVYWDYYHTKTVSSIYWGSLTPGSVGEPVTVYIRNEATEKIRLYKLETNWNPVLASIYLSLSWDYAEGRLLKPGEILKTNLTLSVSHSIQRITTFSFDITVIGSDTLLGDVNEDGACDVMDVAALSKAYGSKPGDFNWDSAADITGDSEIDIYDMAIVSDDFGKTT